MEAIPVPTFESHNRCLTCGYDLFGQPRAGVCPECGASTRESARHVEAFDQPGGVARLREGARLLLASSVLSGLCPGVCLLYLGMEGAWIAPVLMTLIFAATAVTAELGERRFAGLIAAEPDARPRDLRWDVVAGAGLVAINAAAYLATLSAATPARAIVSNGEFVAAATLGCGFFLLSVSAWRAGPSHELRARVAAACYGGRRRGFAGLGVVKAFYETLWLATCWLTLVCLAFERTLESVGVFVAFAALLGLIGYAVLWLVSIVMHAALVVRIGRRFGPARRGFEVVAPAR